MEHTHSTQHHRPLLQFPLHYNEKLLQQQQQNKEDPLLQQPQHLKQEGDEFTQFDGNDMNTNMSRKASITSTTYDNTMMKHEAHTDVLPPSSVSLSTPSSTIMTTSTSAMPSGTASTSTVPVLSSAASTSHSRSSSHQSHSSSHSSSSHRERFLLRIHREVDLLSDPNQNPIHTAREYFPHLFAPTSSNTNQQSGVQGQENAAKEMTQSGEIPPTTTQPLSTITPSPPLSCPLIPYNPLLSDTSIWRNNSLQYDLLRKQMKKIVYIQQQICLWLKEKEKKEAEEDGRRGDNTHTIENKDRTFDFSTTKAEDDADEEMRHRRRQDRTPIDPVSPSPPLTTSTASASPTTTMTVSSGTTINNSGSGNAGSTQPSSPILSSLQSHPNYTLLNESHTRFWSLLRAELDRFLNFCELPIHKERTEAVWEEMTQMMNRKTVSVDSTHPLPTLPIPLDLSCFSSPICSCGCGTVFKELFRHILNELVRQGHTSAQACLEINGKQTNVCPLAKELVERFLISIMYLDQLRSFIIHNYVIYQRVVEQYKHYTENKVLERYEKGMRMMSGGSGSEALAATKEDDTVKPPLPSQSSTTSPQSIQQQSLQHFLTNPHTRSPYSALPAFLRRSLRAEQISIRSFERGRGWEGLTAELSYLVNGAGGVNGNMNNTTTGSCILCKGLLLIPTLLPCSHIFCLGCLLKQSNFGISCPLLGCQREVTMHEEMRGKVKVEEWMKTARKAINGGGGVGTSQPHQHSRSMQAEYEPVHVAAIVGRSLNECNQQQQQSHLSHQVTDQQLQAPHTCNSTASSSTDDHKISPTMSGCSDESLQNVGVAPAYLIPQTQQQQNTQMMQQQQQIHTPMGGGPLGTPSVHQLLETPRPMHDIVNPLMTPQPQLFDHEHDPHFGTAALAQAQNLHPLQHQEIQPHLLLPQQQQQQQPQHYDVHPLSHSATANPHQQRHYSHSGSVVSEAEGGDAAYQMFDNENEHVSGGSAGDQEQVYLSGGEERQHGQSQRRSHPSNRQTSGTAPPQPSLIRGAGSIGITDADIEAGNYVVGCGGTLAAPLVYEEVVTINPEDGSQQRTMKPKRGYGYSCHCCKTTKEPSQLYFCSNLIEKGKSIKKCAKKVCSNCLTRLYPPEFQQGARYWICPSCQGKCICASCERKLTGKPAVPKKKKGENGEGSRRGSIGEEVAMEHGGEMGGEFDTSYLHSQQHDPLHQHAPPPSTTTRRTGGRGGRGGGGARSSSRGRAAGKVSRSRSNSQDLTAQPLTGGRLHSGHRMDSHSPLSAYHSESNSNNVSPRQGPLSQGHHGSHASSARLPLRRIGSGDPHQHYYHTSSSSRSTHGSRVGTPSRELDASQAQSHAYGTVESYHQPSSSSSTHRRVPPMHHGAVSYPLSPLSHAQSASVSSSSRRISHSSNTSGGAHSQSHSTSPFQLQSNSYNASNTTNSAPASDNDADTPTHAAAAAGRKHVTSASAAAAVAGGARLLRRSATPPAPTALDVSTRRGGRHHQQQHHQQQQQHMMHEEEYTMYDDPHHPSYQQQHRGYPRQSHPQSQDPQHPLHHPSPHHAHSFSTPSLTTADFSQMSYSELQKINQNLDAAVRHLREQDEAAKANGKKRQNFDLHLNIGGQQSQHPLQHDQHQPISSPLLSSHHDLDPIVTSTPLGLGVGVAATPLATEFQLLPSHHDVLGGSRGVGGGVGSDGNDVQPHHHPAGSPPSMLSVLLTPQPQGSPIAGAESLVSTTANLTGNTRMDISPIPGRRNLLRPDGGASNRTIASDSSISSSQPIPPPLAISLTGPSSGAGGAGVGVVDISNSGLTPTVPRSARIDLMSPLDQPGPLLSPQLLDDMILQSPMMVTPFRSPIGGGHHGHHPIQQQHHLNTLQTPNTDMNPPSTSRSAHNSNLHPPPISLSSLMTPFQSQGHSQHPSWPSSQNAQQHGTGGQANSNASQQQPTSSSVASVLPFATPLPWDHASASNAMATPLSSSLQLPITTPLPSDHMRLSPN